MLIKSTIASLKILNRNLVEFKGIEKKGMEQKTTEEKQQQNSHLS